jgi:hypothetical protein
MVSAHYGCYGASGQCLVNEIVAIQPFASDCEEKLAWTDGSRIDRISFGNRLGIEIARSGDKFGNPGKRQIHFYPAPVALTSPHS